MLISDGGKTRIVHNVCMYCCKPVKYPDGVYNTWGNLFHKECIRKYSKGNWINIMRDKVTIESILGQISDPAVRILAEHSLKVARKALDMSEYSRIQFVVDEIHKVMPKALKVRTNHETSQD